MRNNDIILNEQLNKINSLIVYDRSKTLSEQTGPPAFMPGGGPNAYELMARGSSQMWDNAVEFFKDPHNVLMAVELGAMFIAPFTGPFAPVFLGVSIAAGLADSAVYYFVDDDPHSALMAFALTLVPEAKLGKYFKRSNWFIRKYGRGGANEVLEKFNKYQKGDKSIKFTDEEIKFLKESGEDLAEESTQAYLKQEMKATVKKGLLQIAAEKTVKGLLALIVNTLKFTGKTLQTIGGMGLMLGGTYVTFDQIYLAIWGDDADRQKSELKKIADLVSQFSGQVKEWLISIYNEQIGGIVEDEEEYKRYEDTVLPKNEPIQSADEYMAAKERVYQERQANLPGKKVTLDNIRLGKEDLHYGDQGPTVKQIQQMLIDLGLDVGDKGADGFFGDDTKDAVIEFQMYPDEYGLSDSIMLNKQEGIVGKETLLALEKSLKLK